MEQARKIQSFYRRHRRMPTYSELMKVFGYRSKNSVYRLVKKLVKSGALSKDYRGRLIPNNLNEPVRILGSIDAGFPSPSEEEYVDTVSIDEFLIKRPDETFLLEVRGESMKDAGIHEGDLVLVERNASPSPGDIVIAEVDEEWTIKYYRSKRNKIYLEAANERFPNIIPEDKMRISAVVKAVIRKY